MNRRALAVLAASAFSYVTAETVPVGLLPEIATGLSVSEADVGLLLTSYAVVAGAATIPFTALTMRIPRHRLIAVTVAVFAVSQAAAAIAPSLLILTIARLVCALAHGTFWAAIGPVTARLAPPGQEGRATAFTFFGNSLAIVLGVPLSTALGQWLGWRMAFAALAVAGVLCVLALWRVLPPLPALPHDLAVPAREHLRASPAVLRNPRLMILCTVTAVLVIGHFTAYTYIAPLVRRDGGLEGAALSALLLGYGAAGILANLLVGRLVDRWPGPLLAALLLAATAATGSLAFVLGAPGTVAAALLWGGAFTAIPVCLAAAVLRVAPLARDAASAVYVVAFQIGIGGGALLGERLFRAGRLGLLPLLAAGLALIAAITVLAARNVFPTHLPQPAGGDERVVRR